MSSFNKQTLELLRKLGELRADSYEINWEQWEEENSDIEALVQDVENGILEYENKLIQASNELEMLSEYDDENEKIQEAEELIDVLMQGYVLQTLFRRKKAIEEMISSI